MRKYSRPPGRGQLVGASEATVGRRAGREAGTKADAVPQSAREQMTVETFMFAFGLFLVEAVRCHQ